MFGPLRAAAPGRGLAGEIRVPGDGATHGRVGQEIADAIDAGVDGFFTDYPLIGAQVRDKPY